MCLYGELFGDVALGILPLGIVALGIDAILQRLGLGVSGADVGNFSATRDGVSQIHGLRLSLSLRFVWKVVVRNGKDILFNIECFRTIQRVLDYF